MLKKNKLPMVVAKPQQKKDTPDLIKWLEKISGQLERLILCQEKKLSGEVLKNFNSKEEVKNA